LLHTWFYSKTLLTACLKEFKMIKSNRTRVQHRKASPRENEILHTLHLLKWARFSQENRPKAMVVENKNRKIKKNFYSISHKDLRRKHCLQFCRFSHQKRRYVQLWGRAFFGLQPKRREIKIQNAKRKMTMQKSKISVINQL